MSMLQPCLGFILCTGLVLVLLGQTLSVTDFPVPTPNSVLTGIAKGSDGALWFTEKLGNKIGRITTSGVVTEFLLPVDLSSPQQITPGSDGNLWFAEFGNRIGRISTAGGIVEFPVSLL